MNVNLIAFKTLFMKEVGRSKDVLIQAFLSPVITTFLYFLVFGSAVGGNIPPIQNVPYSQFIVPGLIMMALLMNSLMASSSGIYFPRFIGTMSDLLTSPLSYLEIVMGFALSATARALAIGTTIFVIAWLLTGITILHIFFVIVFSLITTLTFSLLGLILGIWAKDFEQLSVVPTLVLTPLTFLGGVFYSVEMLPPAWQKVTLINPIFYMIDGLRWGFFGTSDISPWTSVAIIGALLIASIAILRHMFATGYQLKS
jgi:ABC-2 type transport system permease protein